MKGRRVALALVGITLAATGAGVALKLPCVNGVWGDGFEYRRLCYNDLQPLYYARHLDERRAPYVDEFSEYPTLTGTVMYLAALPSASDRSFFFWNAALLVACAGLTAAALSEFGLLRALMFAVAPGLALYAVHNWDLLAVAPFAAGLWLFRRGRFAPAGAAFGLGAAAKLYPAAAVLTGAVALIRDRRGREAKRYVASGAGIIALWNLPYAIANFSGWWSTWTFHSGRFPDYGTMWFWLWRGTGRGDPDAWRRAADVSGIVAVAGAAIVLGALQVHRRLPMPAATGALVAAFLVVTKVHSPQYLLWMLPFFVAVPGSWPYWAAYSASDLLLYVSSFRWFAESTFDAASVWSDLFRASVYMRGAVLLLAAVHFARSREPAGSTCALDGKGGRNAPACDGP